jgi:hypothetical protein
MPDDAVGFGVAAPVDALTFVDDGCVAGVVETGNSEGATDAAVEAGEAADELAA